MKSKRFAYITYSYIKYSKHPLIDGWIQFNHNVLCCELWVTNLNNSFFISDTKLLSSMITELNVKYCDTCSHLKTKHNAVQDWINAFQGIYSIKNPYKSIPNKTEIISIEWNTEPKYLPGLYILPVILCRVSLYWMSSFIMLSPPVLGNSAAVWERLSCAPWVEGSIQRSCQAPLLCATQAR